MFQDVFYFELKIQIRDVRLESFFKAQLFSPVPTSLSGDVLGVFEAGLSDGEDSHTQMYISQSLLQL